MHPGVPGSAVGMAKAGANQIRLFRSGTSRPPPDRVQTPRLQCFSRAAPSQRSAPRGPKVQPSTVLRYRLVNVSLWIRFPASRRLGASLCPEISWSTPPGPWSSLRYRPDPRAYTLALRVDGDRFAVRPALRLRQILHQVWILVSVFQRETRYC